VGDAAVNLTLHDQRIDAAAGILDRDVTQKK
jgi:hypothetical protein